MRCHCAARECATALCSTPRRTRARDATRVDPADGLGAATHLGRALLDDDVPDTFGSAE